MGMNQTPSSERVHIGFFGKRNAGKSSVMNAVTGQDLAVVSEIRGTTTDPVYKSMELLPLGPVVMIDTPGIDDEGELGELRVRKSYQMLNKTDVAVLVVDAEEGMGAEEQKLIQRFEQKQIPYLVVWNKMDLAKGSAPAEAGKAQVLPVSTYTRQGIYELKEAIARLAMTEGPEKQLVRQFLNPGDVVVLVVPIDKAAPKGRLILPQQQMIRDILEADAISVVTKENRLVETYRKLTEKPKLVITDSQAFAQVAKDTPQEYPLTSFSILFANYKGNLAQAVEGVRVLKTLPEGSRILISEGCTHHRQCGDIGTVKLPAWIKGYTGKNFEYHTTSGTEFPDDLREYSLIIHCGGCMLNEREMKYRLQCAQDQHVPMTNYGIAIACMKGILNRSVQIFPEIAGLLENS
ncbi:MAG: [FeFe] hydrogenase H-cluster maturation GTPase HydF [Lachnospiraceae bacterium]|nr:[FeFe] hydrogenase H-cluster maturation GTPase HydF [Lachnospiraceae bacterium]